MDAAAFGARHLSFVPGWASSSRRGVIVDLAWRLMLIHRRERARFRGK
jgi:hypothetical protein